MKIRILLSILLMSLGASGCYDDIFVSLKEPHFYKGRSDAHQTPGPERAQRLLERFQLVQLDR